MEIYRPEIASGVALNCLRSDKFKTACMSVNLLCQLERETASINALVPYVLRRGSSGPAVRELQFYLYLAAAFAAAERKSAPMFVESVTPSSTATRRASCKSSSTVGRVGRFMAQSAPRVSSKPVSVRRRSRSAVL